MPPFGLGRRRASPELNLTVDASRPVPVPAMDGYPKFSDVHAVEVVLEPGDTLYIPPLW